MALRSMIVSGFRGFATDAKINFAVPSGSPGSGLTVITGSNNSGKSAVLEALRARSGYTSPSFSTGARNATKDFVHITYDIDGKLEEIRSLKPGSSETTRSERDNGFEIFVLQSRRAFNAYFGKSATDRRSYIDGTGLPTSRSGTLDGFSQRLFRIETDPREFNKLLERALGFCPTWAIDCSDQGSYFLRFTKGAHSHTSDGLGEGIVSLFSIVDALYDSSPGNMIVIDEPELSLHPSLQKRLANLLAEYAADRQIVISTHSPYFVEISMLGAGAHIARVKTDLEAGSSIHELTGGSKADLVRLSKDLNNPHLLGTNAKELFFQEDGVILTEGQEDVVLFPDIFRQLGTEVPGSFFGWGVGGAEKMEKIAAVLDDLGFRYVVGILDGDKEDLLEPLRKRFTRYHFVCIPAKDVRTKPARDATPEVHGLLDKTRKIRSEFEPQMRALASDLKKWLQAT